MFDCLDTTMSGIIWMDHHFNQPGNQDNMRKWLSPGIDRRHVANGLTVHQYCINLVGMSCFFLSSGYNTKSVVVALHESAENECFN